MANVNTLGTVGAALSLLCAGTFWLYAFLSGIVTRPGLERLELSMQELMFALALVYMATAIFALLSQLAGLIQLPCLIFGLPVAWYLGYDWYLYVPYLVGLLGTLVLIMAIFVEYSRSEKAFKAPPFSRIRVWSMRVTGSTATRFSKGTARMVLVILTLVPVVVAGFSTYAWSSDVSTLRISVLVNGVAFGSTNVSISVDGEVILTTSLEYNPVGEQGLYVITSHKVTAGTHLVEVDAWNGAQLTDGSVDLRVTEKVLPFTTERSRLTIGYGSV